MSWLWIAIITLTIAYISMVSIFWIGLHRLRSKKNYNTSEKKMNISVVIAFRNEATNLNNLLNSIAEQDYPQHLVEIILVNDHSTDNWQSITNHWIEKLPNLRILNTSSENLGKKLAVNTGIMASKNPFIALTDADCILPQSWLTEIVLLFEAEDPALIIGPVASFGKGFLNNMQALEHASLNASAIGACLAGTPFMASSANLAFNKKTIGYELRMLNPNVPSGDDVFLLHAVKEMGGKIASEVNERFVVKTNAPSGLWQILNQRARWASKTKHYTNFVALIIAFLVLVFNIVLLLLHSISFSNPLYLKAAAFMLTFKMFSDFFLLSSYLKLIGQKKLMWVFIPLQVVYPFYIAFVFLLSLVKPIKWK